MTRADYPVLGTLNYDAHCVVVEDDDNDVGVVVAVGVQLLMFVLP